MMPYLFCWFSVHELLRFWTSCSSLTNWHVKTFSFCKKIFWLPADRNAWCACRWECLKDILLGDWTDGILCSIGMPVIKGSERYNCQVLCFNRKIIMIRPKMWLANDGNYRELRWFTAWKQKDQLVDFQLPTEISEHISQKSVPFGNGFIQFLDT